MLCCLFVCLLPSTILGTGSTNNSSEQLDRCVSNYGTATIKYSSGLMNNETYTIESEFFCYPRNIKKNFVVAQKSWILHFPPKISCTAGENQQKNIKMYFKSKKYTTSSQKTGQYCNSIKISHNSET